LVNKIVMGLKLILDVQFLSSQWMIQLVF